MFAVKGSRVHHPHEEAARRHDCRWPTSSPPACWRWIASSDRCCGSCRRRSVSTRDRLGAFFDLLPRTAGAAADARAEHDSRITADRALVTTPRTRPAAAARARGPPRELPRPGASSTLLRDHDIALVLADNPGKWPVLDEDTTDFATSGCTGTTSLRQRLRRRRPRPWAAKIRGWATPGRTSTSTATTTPRCGRPMTRWACSTGWASAGQEDCDRSRDRRPLAHPKELTYPCCLPALGELGELSPREGPPISVRDRPSPADVRVRPG